jgi:hypothetical protein
MLAPSSRKKASTTIEIQQAQPTLSEDIIIKDDEKTIDASNKMDSEDSTWTSVQSSAKTRRLVPQFNLNKPDLTVDNSIKIKPSQPELVKKKGHTFNLLYQFGHIYLFSPTIFSYTFQ